MEQEDKELKIEELARQVGMTTRNLREWQTLGLLQPPVKRGRVAYYGPHHLDRIARIRDLRSDGFPLELIRRQLEGSTGEKEEELVGLGRALRDRLQNEAPEVIDPIRFAIRFGLDDGEKLKEAIEANWLGRSEELGLMRVRDDGMLEIISPRLAQLSEFLIGLGLSMGALLDLAEDLFKRQEAVAEVFIDVFRVHVFEPFDESDGETGDWAEIRETLERLRPFALDAVEVFFRMAMDRSAERTIQQEIDRRLG